MTDTAIQDALLREFSQLSLPLQQKVVAYAHALAVRRPHGTPAAELDEFFGILSLGDAQTMMREIDAECERVDDDEW